MEEGSSDADFEYFKLRQRDLLWLICTELRAKYPDRVADVNRACSALSRRLRGLERYQLPEYVFILRGYAGEFRELETLIPSEEELDGLLPKPKTGELPRVPTINDQS
ncbi:MAG: hypothetical protein LM564_02510 [Desulfurococcaceae archaeon]|nr:hypothetical protein [Desulfurococcaceae archaeon]